MKRSLPLVALFAFLSAPQQAGAQVPASPSSLGPSEARRSEEARPPSPGGDAKVRRAQSHFQRGVQLYEEGNYEGALAEFARAHELVPNYRILYNLAQTQVERHDYVEAVSLFAEYLEQGGAEIPAPRREATVRERDGLLERIATIRIESNVGGAELWVDGRSRGVVPRIHSLRLNSGHSELRFQKSGYLPVTREVTLAGGDSTVVEIELQSVTAPSLTPESDAAEPASNGGSSMGIWVSAAATTLLAGATATFAVLTSNENRDLDRELDRFQPDSTNLDETRSRVRTFAGLTDAFGVATALGFASTLYFAFSGSGGEPRVDPSTAESSRARRVQVLVGTTHVALRGSF